MKKKNVFYPVRLFFKKRVDKFFMRYFFVSYVYRHGDSIFGRGECTLKSRDYPNRDKLINDLIKINDNMETGVITNIIELTESDYNDFTREVSNE